MTVHAANLIRLMAVAASAAALAACASTPADYQADARLSTEHYKAQVVERPEEIQLAVHAQGLSPNQAAALEGFVADWRGGDAGTIRIAAPSAGDPAAVSRAVADTRSLLRARGVPAELIEVAGYEGAAGAPLRVSYRAYGVELPRCGASWGNLTSTSSNAPQSNFGCAVTANMAAQIANPADLLRPRGEDPADAARRSVVLDKYRKGEVTSAAENEGAKGAVSNAVR